MLGYQIWMAWKSLRRNPVLSSLVIAGIALGIAVSTTFVTTYYVMAQNPIPHKSDQLFYVQVDNWEPNNPWRAEKPDEPPDQLNYRDAMALMESDIPTYKSAMFKAHLTVHPDADGQRPFRSMARLTFGDFFPMFDVPFVYGGGWGKAADEGPDPVVVLDAEINQRLFGGENSVGRTVRIEDRDFTVVGVLARWDPHPKFYDLTNATFAEPEAIYMPFHFAEAMEIQTAGNTNGWKFEPGNEYQDLLQAETLWIQMWAQLDDSTQRAAYASYMDAYVEEQQRLGRLQRPLNNRLRPVMEWLDANEAVPPQARTLLIIGVLFLIVCSVNLIGILLGKFLARAPEVGVRRALGASRRSVFLQHLVECEVVGVIGGLAGILLSIPTLRVINRMFFPNIELFSLDGNMVVAGLVLALLAGLLAGLYPAWRICRLPPAIHLKLQ
jgi:putative ABC transport system permease protein